jgi:hypothetical protein
MPAESRDITKMDLFIVVLSSKARPRRFPPARRRKDRRAGEAIAEQHSQR